MQQICFAHSRLHSECTTLANPSRLPRTPDATHIYAVGDIHGRLDLLDGVVRELRAAARQAGEQGVRLIAIFLGDYMDRGPASSGVLRSLIEFRDAGVCDVIFLRGNHEQVLLDLIDGGETTVRWLEYGGRETLASYGVEKLPPNCDAASLRAVIAQVVPPEHVAFLRETGIHVLLGDYLFVHAGLRPDRLLEEQTDADLLWFRYYEDETPVWDYTVIHGHSPSPQPVVGRWRMGIDTEAHASGALTALRLQGEEQQLLKIAIGAGTGVAAATPWTDVDRSYRKEEPMPQSRPREETGGPAPQPRRKRKSASTRTRRPKRAGAGVRRFVAGAVGVVLVGAAGAGALAIGASKDPALHTAVNDSKKLEVVLAGAPAPVVTQTLQPSRDNPVQATPQAAPADGAADVPASAPEASAARVQIAAAPSAEAAQRLWQDVARTFPEPTHNKTLQVETIQSGGQTLHRVLVAGFADAGAATEFCRTLQAGGHGCLVRKSAEPAQASPASDRKVAARVRSPADES